MERKVRSTAHVIACEYYRYEDYGASAMRFYLRLILRPRVYTLGYIRGRPSRANDASHPLS